MVNMRKFLTYIILIVFTCTIQVMAEDIVVELSAPSEVILGEQFQLHCTVNTIGGTNVELASSVSENFDIVMGPSTSTSRSKQIVKGKMSDTNATIFTYILIAKKAGNIRIEPATVKVENKIHKSNDVTIKVFPADDEQSEIKSPASLSADIENISDNDIFLLATISEREVYEQKGVVVVTFKIYTIHDISNLQNVRYPEFEGFLSHDVKVNNQWDIEQYNKRNYHTAVIKQVELRPLRPGRLQIGSAEIEAAIRVRKKSQERDFFNNIYDTSENVMKTLVSAPIEIDVKPMQASSSSETIKEEIVAIKTDTVYTVEKDPLLPEKAAGIFPDGIKSATIICLFILILCVFLLVMQKNPVVRKIAMLSSLIAFFACLYFTFSGDYKDRTSHISGNHEDMKTTEKEEKTDVIILLDISSSMLAEDLKPNRLNVMKDAVNSYIQSSDANIGLVFFAGESYTQIQPTTDKASLQNHVTTVETGRIEDGTAIGTGIINAVNNLKECINKNKVIILLTDGKNNGGEIAPVTASEIAGMFDIRIYAIGIGAEGEAPYPFKTPNGVKYQNIPVDIDEAMLRNITSETGGEYFRVTNENELETIIRILKDKIVETKNLTTQKQVYSYINADNVSFVLDEFLQKDIKLRKQVENNTEI